MKIIIITGFHKGVNSGSRVMEDVTLGKAYRIFKDFEGKIFFEDDAGDDNYGADVSKQHYMYDTYKRVEEE